MSRRTSSQSAKVKPKILHLSLDRQAETFGFSKAAAALVVFVLLGLALIASWGNCAAAKSDAEPLADQAESSDALPSEKDYTRRRYSKPCPNAIQNIP